MRVTLSEFLGMQDWPNERLCEYVDNMNEDMKKREELIRDMWLCFYEAPYVCVNPEALRDRAIEMGIDMEVRK